MHREFGADFCCFAPTTNYQNVIREVNSQEHTTTYAMWP